MTLNFLPDTHPDLVFARIARVQKYSSWTAEKRQQLTNLERLLQAHGYTGFAGHPRRYHLTRVGQSCLVRVPRDRKGLLEPYRGRTIRLVCTRSGQFRVWIMAGKIQVH